MGYFVEKLYPFVNIITTKRRADLRCAHDVSIQQQFDADFDDEFANTVIVNITGKRTEFHPRHATARRTPSENA